MMLPILISVSVAPVSYFFCASAPPDEAANSATAAERIASLRVVAGICGSPCDESREVPASLARKLFGWRHSIPFAKSLQQKRPPRGAREAASLVGRLTRSRSCRVGKGALFARRAHHHKDCIRIGGHGARAPL